MKPAPEITAIARPVRVTFVIEDGGDVHPFLDAAFRESFGRHGGRQSLVVPVIDGDIPESYIRWLKVFDPDIAFVVASDNERIAGVLDLTCSPLLIHPVKRYPTGDERVPRGFQLYNQALTSLSWLPFLKVASGGFRARPEVILDCYPRWQDDGLITDNFGTLHDSFHSFPLHRELADIIRPLMLTPKDAPQDRWRFGIESDEITDGYEALDALTKAGQTISLAYLSNIHSKHILVRSHRWTDSFCLIVGDAFVDRVSCWNAGLLFDDARNQTYKTLRLPASVVDDPAKIERVKKFINGNNWINRYGGQYQVTVRSSSLTEAQLKDFAQQVGGKGSWCFYHVQPIGSIEDCCPPPPKERESAWMLRRPDDPDVQIPLRHKTESVPVPQPFQLKHAPSAHPICSTGQWMAHYRVDRTEDHNRFANLRDTWCLPKRNQLIRLFLGRTVARITAGGALAVPVDREVQRVEISEPSDRDFFFALLHEPPAYSYPDIRYQERYDIGYGYSRSSDKGRYLQGVLGMFGSLDRAYQVLTHGFWRRQFIKLGTPSESQYPHFVRVLQKRFPPQAGTYVFDNQDKWESLARTFVRQAPNVRLPKYTVKLQTLVKEWLKDLERALETDAHLKERKADILAQAPRELTDSLDALCREGIFHQGYSWACSHCGYRNWTALDALRMALECQVCRQEHNTPIDLEFDFRLNEFLASCIREHDTLSVVWALGRLQRGDGGAGVGSFIFAPQTELFRKWPETESTAADREIDLLCTIDGKVVIGEVKTSLAEIDNQEVDNLIEAAGELRADVVVIGAMVGDKGKLGQKLEAVRKRVGPNIEVLGLLGDKDGNDIEHFLP
jgi:hypothetical protein